MLIDFHTHSSASDGALSPQQLVERAQAAGIALLAITDHDVLRGYEQARCHLEDISAELRLVPGVELSCRWGGATIHVLGLGFDPDHTSMSRASSVLGRARQDRAREIDARLTKRGFDGGLAGALRVAGESQLGRPHFAQWMVEAGHVADANEAFDRYLGRGKMGDVKAFWPALADVVTWIVDAGGVAVLAHPLKYRFTGMKLRRLIADFMAAGGTGIETHSGRQSADQVRHLQRLAREFDLEVSVGSDFHRDAPHGPTLGVEFSASDELRGVWERWLPA